jgi:hypothetical protein
MCKFRLGRSELQQESSETVNFSVDSIAVSDLVLCLKRIRKSIQHWRKEGGRRGYFEFVGQFLL